MPKKNATVESWYIAETLNGTAWVLRGNCTSHPVMGTAHHLRSSLIVSLDMENNICETMNTIYTLVGPSINPIPTNFKPMPAKAEAILKIASELPRSKLRSIKGIRPRTDSSNQE